VWGDADGRVRDWEQLGVLTLLFLDLSNLLVVWRSEFFKPGVRIGVYALDVSVWTGLFRACYPIVC
jgi:hypothetical protein